MKKILLIILSVLVLAGCGTIANESAAGTPTPTPEPTETPTPEPKKPEDVLYDVIYMEDEMTGDRQYWSEYNYYYNKDRVILPNNFQDFDFHLSYFEPTLYQREDALIPYLILRYEGDDWIFFDHWMIKTDDEEPVDISLEDLHGKRDVSSGTVTEKYSFIPGTGVMDVLKKIADCESCKMRFYGEKSFTFDLTEDELRSAKHIVAMYEDYISE